MSSKLKNIKAVNELVAGTHRTQTRKTFGFSDTSAEADKNKTREIGEIWEEDLGNGRKIWWEQKQGYRIKRHIDPETAKILAAAHKFSKSFPKCPKETCTCTAPTRIDETFRRKTGMCEDCTISAETQLKIKGKFDQYAKEKMSANADSFFANADKEVEILKQTFKDPIAFVANADGLEEKWETNSEYFIKQIDEQYNSFKEKVKEKLQP